jgi:prepilin-type N-terminal cleavage/methylation domain-containing protein
MNRRGFTLLELLMAFGAGSILLATIYFFYFGILQTTVRATTKIDLNGTAELALQTLVTDLRMAYRFSEFRPHRFMMQRLPGATISADEIADISSVKLTTVEYEVFRDKDTKRVALWRCENKYMPGKNVIECDDIDLEMFTGYVLDLPREKEDTMPKFHVLDYQAQSSNELARVTLMRVNLKLKIGQDSIQLVSKIHMPIVHNATLQGNWNLE